MSEFSGLWKTKTHSMHCKLGYATLSQLAFLGESYPSSPWEKSQRDNKADQKYLRQDRQGALKNVSAYIKIKNIQGQNIAYQIISSSLTHCYGTRKNARFRGCSDLAGSLHGNLQQPPMTMGRISYFSGFVCLFVCFGCCCLN